MGKTLTLFVAALCVAITAPVSAQGQSMSFFVSSTGSGSGGNLGGLAGADKHCQTLAAKAGAGNRKWQAYLSTSGPDVNARDRIGSGPWYNAKSVLIASNVADLHSDKANINNDTALDEQGRQINPQGGPNRHDILTGSTAEGRATTMTCQNWTSSASEHSAMLWGITTASRSANLVRPGTRLTRPMAARRRTWWRPGVPGCFTVLRPIDSRASCRSVRL